MDIDLTEKEMEEVSNFKNILRDVIYGNVGNDIDRIVEIFEEVITASYSDMNIKVDDITLYENIIKIRVFVKNKPVEFEVSLQESPESQRRQGFEALVNECEPWRKKNPKLDESDRKIKEWANSFDGSYEPPYGFFMWVEMGLMGKMK